MLIKKFSRLKNGLYKLYLENDDTVIVHEDYMLKNELLLTKKIDEKDVKRIEQITNNYCAYDWAVKYIGVKCRSCYDVYQFLLKKEIDIEIIDKVIEKLKQQKYLDDYSFSKAFINDKIKFSTMGPYKIKRELESKKIDKNIIDETLNIYDESVQLQKLEKLVPKYIRTIRNKSYIMMKNKTCLYFSNLGFDNNLVLEVISKVDYNEGDFRQKEYDKLYKKLSKKFSGEELEFKIKQSLYKNGYK